MYEIIVFSKFWNSQQTVMFIKDKSTFLRRELQFHYAANCVFTRRSFQVIEMWLNERFRSLESIPNIFVFLQVARLSRCEPPFGNSMTLSAISVENSTPTSNERTKIFRRVTVLTNFKQLKQRGARKRKKGEKREKKETTILNPEGNSPISGWLRSYLCTLKEEKYQCLPATESKIRSITLPGTARAVLVQSL